MLLLVRNYENSMVKGYLILCFSSRNYYRGGF